MPLLLMWAAWLLLSSFHHNHVSAAANLEQIMDVIKNLTKMEEKVIAFGVELENAYKKRCETDTYNICLNNNYYDCSSKYPNQMCIKDKFNTSDCEDGGIYCNGELLSEDQRAPSNCYCHPRTQTYFCLQLFHKHSGRIKRYPRFLFHTPSCKVTIQIPSKTWRKLHATVA